MKAEIRRGILVDSGFWIALCDERDEHSPAAQSILEYCLAHPLFIPWPIQYEVLCTRFVRRPALTAKFDHLLHTLNTIPVDDSAYRNTALRLTIESATIRKRAISMTDMVLRGILSDEQFRITHLITFNPNDFRDICVRRRIEIIPAP